MDDKHLTTLKDSEGRSIFIGNIIEFPVWDSDDNFRWAFRYKVLSQGSMKFLGSEFQDFKYGGAIKPLTEVIDEIDGADVTVLCLFDCSECEANPEGCGKCHDCGREWAAVNFQKDQR